MIGRVGFCDDLNDKNTLREDLGEFMIGFSTNYDLKNSICE